MTNDTASAPAPVTFGKAFWYWLKLGFISFGGPTGQIAIMHQDLVEKKRWISERRFLHALNYCMVLPGPEATQLAAYIGWMMHRTWGGIVAGTLFFLPSLFILIGLSWIYMAYGNVPVVAGILYGINMHNSGLVIFDRFSLENGNSVVFAKSGAGKSFLVKLESLRSLMFDAEIIVIDPEDEYRRMCESVNGQYIEFSFNAAAKILDVLVAQGLDQHAAGRIRFYG